MDARLSDADANPWRDIRASSTFSAAEAIAKRYVDARMGGTATPKQRRILLSQSMDTILFNGCLDGFQAGRSTPRGQYVGLDGHGKWSAQDALDAYSKRRQQ